MSVHRSKSSRRFIVVVLCFVFCDLKTVIAGTGLGGYPEAIRSSSSYRGYGSDLANRPYSITPASLAYHSSDSMSVPLSQIQDYDVISSSAAHLDKEPLPSNANLVRYIILKEYHVLQDGTMVPGGAVIQKAEGGSPFSEGGFVRPSPGRGTVVSNSVRLSGTSAASPAGGYSGSSSSSSGGYASPPASSAGGYSNPPTVDVAGMYGPPSQENSGEEPSTVRAPLIRDDDSDIEITRVVLPDSDEVSTNGVQGGRSSGNLNAISGEGYTEGGQVRDDTNRDNNERDNNNDDDGGNADEAEDDNDLDDEDDNDDEVGDDTEEDGPSNSNMGRGSSSSGGSRGSSNNSGSRAPGTGGSRGSSNSNRAGGSNSDSNRDSTFQVTPAQGVTLGSNNNNQNRVANNRPPSASGNTRTQNSNPVVTDAFMFSEPNGGGGAQTNRQTGTTRGRGNNGNTSSRNRTQSRRNRNRNNRGRNRNSTTTTTEAPASTESDELKPIVLPTAASPQLQEALALVAQFAQQQADLLSRTKQQAKSIAGSVFNSLSIPGLASAFNSSTSPYAQSVSPVNAAEVSIQNENATSTVNLSGSTGPSSPSIIKLQQIQAPVALPQSSSPALQTTYGIPSSTILPGFSVSGFHQQKAAQLSNLHQQLSGLKAGLKAGILSSVQNTVAAVQPKGETGTTSSPHPIYGAPAPTRSHFQIIKAVKGHFLNKVTAVPTHFVNKGQRFVGHFANKGATVVGHFANKGRNVKNHFLSKGAALTQKATTLADTKHMHIQNVIKQIQTIFQHNPTLTAW